MITLTLNLNDLLTHYVTTSGMVQIDLDKELARQGEIAIIWGIEDVSVLRPDLDAYQAWEVLKTVRDEHDASIGINWDTLQYYADKLFPHSSIIE